MGYRRAAGAGCSDGSTPNRGTITKEQFFSACLAWHLRREAQELARLRHARPYLHADLNAGPGYNGAARVVGTPTLFMRHVPKFPALPIEAWFVDSNPATVTALRQYLALPFYEARDMFVQRNFHPVSRDNQLFLDRFLALVEQFGPLDHVRGSIISDPNGWSRAGGAVTLESLHGVLTSLPRFILLVHFHFGAGKKNRGWLAADPTMRRMTVRYVADHLPLRRYWLITEPWGGGGGHVALCGSNYRIPDDSALRRDRKDGFRLFHTVDSPRGQELLSSMDGVASLSERGLDAFWPMGEEQWLKLAQGSGR